MPLPGGGLLPSPGLFPGTIGPYTQQLLNSWAPWLAYDASGHLWIRLVALGSMFEQVFGIVADQGDPQNPASYVPGWSGLLDPDNCPTQFLPYLSQFNGTGVQPGTSDADARAIIKAESGFNRGTLSAIQSAIQRAQATPDPTKYAVVERTGPLGAAPYQFLVLIDTTSLTTQGDTTQLVANVTAVKPAGLLFTVIPFSAPLVSQYTRLFSAITATLASAQLSDVT